MALIGTIREKMGIGVVIFVALAIAAFVLSDIFSGQSSILNWGRNTVGEIAGKEISYEEFQSVVREREASFFLQTGREATERELPSLRQQAWDLLISRHAIQAQFSKVGIQVTPDEEWDMVQGKNIDSGIREAFTNPQTGQLEVSSIVSYLQQLNAMPVGSEQRIRWELFQKDLKPARERIKYENLLIKTNYVTKAEAERLYHSQIDVAEAKYLYVPFYAIPDTAAQVTDAALQAYYNKNKERYKTEATRDVKYVTFSIAPSATDSAIAMDDIKKALDAFKNASEDSVYAFTHAEGNIDPYGKYTYANLPEGVNADDLTEGNVIGPVLDGELYLAIKVSKVVNDTVANARAKHILIKPEDSSAEAKAKAKEKARGILKEIKAGADFGVKALEHGTDGTATRGGDLGWFSTGQMVKPFNDAVFKATKTGLLDDVVETDFGFHIISITNTKTTKAFYLAIVDRAIAPGDATLNESYRMAEEFANNVTNEAEFLKKASEEGLPVFEAKNVLAGSSRLNTLNEARPLVMWLFREAKTGKVSQVYDIDDQNVVAIMTGEVKKGYRSFESVKDEILPIVRNEVKAKIIADKLKGLTGSLEEIAAAFGSDANVYTTSDLRLNSNSLPTAGFNPSAIGGAFGVEEGKNSAPITGENGVLVFNVLNKTVAPALSDYYAYVQQLEQNALRNSTLSIAEAIKANSNIEDLRYKFF
jgi:peptidyl-prolyl cis-trans isomerase D